MIKGSPILDVQDRLIGVFESTQVFIKQNTLFNVLNAFVFFQGSGKSRLIRNYLSKRIFIWNMIFS